MEPLMTLPKSPKLKNSQKKTAKSGTAKDTREKPTQEPKAKRQYSQLAIPEDNTGVELFRSLSPITSIQRTCL